MKNKEIFAVVQELEFVLTKLYWDDVLQPGELEQARYIARALLQAMYADDNTISD
jgi:hypothetical protein